MPADATLNACVVVRNNAACVSTFANSSCSSLPLPPVVEPKGLQLALRGR